MNVQLNNINEYAAVFNRLIEISKDEASTKIELKGEAKGTSKVYVLTEEPESDFGYCDTTISKYKAQVLSNVSYISIERSTNRLYITSKINSNHSATAAFCLAGKDILVLDECIVNAITHELNIMIIIKK